MQSLSPRSILRAPLVHACVLAVAGSLLVACDRHSAKEVPESYGHGSSHQTSYTDHEIDSRKGTRSFSDTQGIQEEQAESADEAPAASPAASAHPGFFPKNN